MITRVFPRAFCTFKIHEVLPFLRSSFGATDFVRKRAKKAWRYREKLASERIRRIKVLS